MEIPTLPLGWILLSYCLSLQQINYKMLLRSSLFQPTVPFCERREEKRKKGYFRFSPPFLKEKGTEKRKGLASLHHEENTPWLFMRSRRREGDYLNAKKVTLCHLFPSLVTRLLCCIRGSCSLFQELTWDAEENIHPPTLTMPAKDHSKNLYGNQLFVLSPPIQFLSMFSAASCDSGKLYFPLRNKCQWINTIILYSVVFALHALLSLCFMS